jgi:hypothetical protein
MYTFEKSFNIWNDDLEYRIEVCDDSDGLGMVEIRYVENNKIGQRVTIEKGMIPFLIEALKEKMQ